jgi:hypothetical protein
MMLKLTPCYCLTLSASACILLSALCAAREAADAGDTMARIIDTVKVPAAGVRLNPADVAIVKGYPPMGKWMYQDDLEKAHWLGIPWEGKNLIEPINVVFVDAVSKTADESIGNLVENLTRGEFTDRTHHSSGYVGAIGGVFYPQLPRERYHAYSNAVAEIPNNHGRIFGPCHYQGKFIFIAAFSREIIEPGEKVLHHYGSFKRARDELSQSLDKKSSYKITGFVNLGNAIVNDAENTTADHDGNAVVLSLKK